LVRITHQRLGFYLAILIAGLVAAACIRSGLYVAGGSDSSAYISAGEQWRTGDLFRSEPFDFWPSLPPGIGFPLLIAAATSAVGPIGSHLLAPLMAGLLVWCSFGLARELAGGLAGLVAAVLVATSPELLVHSVQAMGDGPAAACWMAAWWLSLRPTRLAAMAAGAMTAAAILIRPNLAPLAMIVLGVIVTADAVGNDRRARRWSPAALFVATAGLGVAVFLWTQAVLYGGPLMPGYPNWNTMFDTRFIATNARVYPRQFIDVHTALPLAGLVMVVWISRPSTPFDRRARRITLSAFAFVFINVALYLPYTTYDEWPFLRFLLPGTVALFVLFAATLSRLTELLWAHARWLAVAVPLVAALVVGQGLPLARYALEEWTRQRSVQLMGHYLREVLPQNAVVLSFAHSGAVAHYTGRDILRADAVPPPTLDGLVDSLARRGYRPVLVIDQLHEEASFRQLFAGSRYGRLDWPARAEFYALGAIKYFDFSDQARHRQGERLVTDTLR
jgi:Dolichyl-phosphate-mannose-protein mannosyltransferase